MHNKEYAPPGASVPPDSVSRTPEARMAVCFGLLVCAGLLAAHSAAPAVTGNSAGLTIISLAAVLVLVVMALAMIAALLRDSIRQTEAARADDAAQSRIAGLLESLPSAFFALDNDGRLTYANGQAEAFLQHPRPMMQGRPLADLLPLTLSPDFDAQCRRAQTVQSAAHFECCDETAARWYEVDAAPTPHGLSITVSDITPRKHVEEAQSRLLAILEATPDLVAINDMRGKICYFNRAGREMLGLPPTDTLEGVSHASGDAASGDTALQGVGDSELQDDVFPIGLENGVWQGDMLLRTRDRRSVPVSQVVIAHRGADGKVAYLSTIARDISERKRAAAQMQQNLDMIREQKAALEQHQAELIQKNDFIAHTCAQLKDANRLLKEQATTDGLTGLKNHRAFQERMALEYDRSARYHTPLSLLILDVDTFKQYNDCFGHPAGDEVLKTVAQLLQATARTTDMAARYGGEEFVVILPDTDEAGALDAGERVRAAIENAAWDKRAVTVSVGVASMRPDTPDVSTLIAQADQALYVSKEFGRNRVTHYDVLLNELPLCHIES